jgi:hypothetical protein
MTFLEFLDHREFFWRGCFWTTLFLGHRLNIQRVYGTESMPNEAGL